jgi:hypothetical protein
VPPQLETCEGNRLRAATMSEFVDPVAERQPNGYLSEREQDIELHTQTGKKHCLYQRVCTH